MICATGISTEKLFSISRFHNSENLCLEKTAVCILFLIFTVDLDFHLGTVCMYAKNRCSLKPISASRGGVLRACHFIKYKLTLKNA